MIIIRASLYMDLHVHVHVVVNVSMAALTACVHVQLSCVALIFIHVDMQSSEFNCMDLETLSAHYNKSV